MPNLSGPLSILLYSSLVSWSIATGTMIKRDDPTFSQPLGDMPRQVCSAPAAPKDPKIRCNFRGVLNEPKEPIASGQVRTFEECRDRCLLNGDCVSFGFEGGSRQCKHFNTTIRKQKGKKSNTGFIYNNRRCFVPKYFDRQPVLNSGFEDGGIDPWHFQNYSPLLAQPGEDSANALFQQINADAAFIMTQEPLFLCKGVVYDLTLSYRLAPGGTYFSEPECDRIDDPFLSGRRGSVQTGNTLAFLDASQEGTWITKTVTFPALPNSGNFQLYMDAVSCGATGSGNNFGLSLDNIQLTARA